MIPIHRSSLPTSRAARLPGATLLAALLAAASLTACTTETVCTSAQVLCNGQCISLDSDAANCGACGRSCGAGQSCSAGLCCQGDQCPPALYAACFNTAAVQGATRDLVAVGAPVAVEGGPIAFAWDGDDLWVANSMSSTLDRLRVSPAGIAPVGTLPTVTIPVTGPYADLEYLAARNGRLYVSNAAVGSMLVVDAVSGTVLDEVMLGAYSYPQGMAFVGNKAYVALNGSGAVAVVNLAAAPPVVTKTIDLTGLVAANAMPLPFRMAVAGARLYVTLWNLDFTYAPAGHGKLAVVDTATDELVAGVNPVDLGGTCLNSGGIAQLGSTLWVTCGWFPWNGNTVSGAAFVPVDVSGASPVVGNAVLVDAAAPGALVFCGGTGFAGDRFSGNVLRFDPTTRSVSARGLVCPPPNTGSSFVPDVTCGR